jgi:hypothetical protein
LAILSRISGRDRTPLPSPKASHESEIGKWTKRVHAKIDVKGAQAFSLSPFVAGVRFELTTFGL